MTNNEPSCYTQLDKAIDFAKKAHVEHKRKYSGEPYFVHLESVANLTKQADDCISEAALCAAYLHDCVEDVGVTIEDIRKEFGDYIAELVFWLTDFETEPKQGNRATRKLMSLWRLSAAPYEAKMIKIADLINNTADITKHDTDFAIVYITEKSRILDAFEGFNDYPSEHNENHLMNFVDKARKQILDCRKQIEQKLLETALNKLENES